MSTVTKLSSILHPNSDCNYTITIKERTVSDPERRCLYSTANAVSLLPIRRVSTKVGQLQETIILLRELQPHPLTALIRIKHVAVNFSADFNNEKGCVPGQRFIGRISINTEPESSKTTMARGQRVFVYPYSTCLIQNFSKPCMNCRHRASIPDVPEDDRKALYEIHRDFPCLIDWLHGKTIHGGLQDYIRVPHPLKQLIPIPELVSLHDCCFLLDVATPFLVYCKEILCAMPDFSSKVIVILNDVSKEVNDCLLILRHLLLDEHLFSFTDMQIISAHPEIMKSYTSQFSHIFVFAAGQQAFETGLIIRDACADSRVTISIMAQSSEHLEVPDSIQVQKVSISFKDKFLLETLLETISEMNNVTGNSLAKRYTWCSNSSIGTEENTHEYGGDLILDDIDIVPHLSLPMEALSESKLGCPKFSVHSTSDNSFTNKSPSKKVIRWLQCDYSFLLGLDDLCEQDLENPCILTRAINRLRAEGFGPKRVFFTNTQSNNAILNAFVFS